MWQERLDYERQQPYFKKLLQKVEEEYQTKTVFPPFEQIFNAFDVCPFDNVKVVILGQDPYHNHHQAHGLAFSVLKGNPIPPSLRNMFKELQDDLGIQPPTHGDLTSWAEEGVLLLNTILTVVAHQPLSHKGIGWEQFTDRMIQYLNKDNRPKVFVLWGNNAKAKASLITNKNHLILSSSHPSPLSARHSFFGSKVYSKINQFLTDHNRQPINFTIK